MGEVAMKTILRRSANLGRTEITAQVSGSENQEHERQAVKRRAREKEGERKRVFSDIIVQNCSACLKRSSLLNQKVTWTGNVSFIDGHKVFFSQVKMADNSVNETLVGHATDLDEQERVQKKVFSNWINYYVPGCIQYDLIEELRDGTKLLALLEALTGETLHGERGRRLRRPHFISNVNIALQLLERRRVKLVNIHATDIVDGNPSIVLGLIWVIILHFHIQDYFKLTTLEHNNEVRGQSPYMFSSSITPTPAVGSTTPTPAVPRPANQASVGLKRTLLDNLSTRFGLNVNDFGPSWRSGEAFLFLIDAMMPQLDAVQRGRELSTNYERLQLAFDLAQLLGIGPLLDPEDIDIPSPDERSVMTYVCQFMQKLSIIRNVTIVTTTQAPPTASAEEPALHQQKQPVVRSVPIVQSTPAPPTPREEPAVRQQKPPVVRSIPIARTSPRPLTPVEEPFVQPPIMRTIPTTPTMSPEPAAEEPAEPKQPEPVVRNVPIDLSSPDPSTSTEEIVIHKKWMETVSITETRSTSYLMEKEYSSRFEEKMRSEQDNFQTEHETAETEYSSRYEERKRSEQDELQAEREEAEKEAAETEAAAREAAERERAEREAAEKKAAESEAAERERAKREAVEKERAERERAERERVEREKAERERAERKRVEEEAAERERVEREAAKKERARKEAAEKERARKEAAEKEAAEREAAEREAAEREAAEREAAEREAAEREAAEREAAEREAAEREAAEREAAEREAAEREAAEREAAAREAAEREKLLAEAAEKAAAKARRIQNLIERLRKIQVWLEFNDIEDFKTNELASVNESTLERAISKKADFDTKRSELQGIFDDINFDEDEAAADMYTELVKEVEAVDWDTFIKELQELLKVKTWLNDTESLLKSFKLIRESKEWTRTYIVESSEEIIIRKTTLNDVDMGLVDKLSPQSDLVAKRTADLEELSEQLTSLSSELSQHETLKGEFDKLADQLMKWIDEADAALEDSLKFTDIESMNKVEDMLKHLSVDIKSQAEPMSKLNELEAKLNSSPATSDSSLTERGILLNELNAKWDKIKKVCSRKVDSFETLRDVYISCSRRSVELEALQADAETVMPPARPATIFSQAKNLSRDFKSLENEILKKLPDTKELSETWPFNCDSRCKLWSSSCADLLNRYQSFLKNRDDLIELLEKCILANEGLSKAIDDVDSMKKTGDKLTKVNELLSNMDDSLLFIKLKDQLDFIVGDLSADDKYDMEARIAEIQESKKEMKLRLDEMKKTIGDRQSTLSELNSQLKKATKAMDEIEYGIVEASILPNNLEEKSRQLEAIKELQNKLKTVDLAKINSLSDPELDEEVTQLKERFEVAQEKIKQIADSKEKAYGDHNALKQAIDEFEAWLKIVKDKMPSLSVGSLSDRLNLETSISKFTDLQSMKPIGQEKMKNIQKLATVAKETSSPDGQKHVESVVATVETEFGEVFGGIDKSVINLNELQVEYKRFKEGYEEVSDWLQSMERDIKQEKTVYKGSTLDEKLENVSICNKMLADLESVHVNKISKLAKDCLLKSHLETYIRNQVKLVESRYQVHQNLLREVTNKVNEIADAHSNFSKKVTVALDFISKQSIKLDECKKALAEPESTRKLKLEEAVKMIQQLSKKNQDEGQALVQAALHAGERGLLSTPGGGRDVITMEMHDVQAKWDRFGASVHEVTVSLESELVKLQENEANLLKATLWLSEQEAKLDELKTNKDTGISEECNIKASIKRLSSLLQDAVAHDATIKAAEKCIVDQSQPISVRYESFLTHVQMAIDDAQKKMGALDEFSRACDDFEKWIGAAKEKLGNCSFANEKRETVNSKLSLIKKLLGDDEGSDKLKTIKRLCEKAKAGLTTSGVESLGQQVVKLESDYDAFQQILTELKASLDVSEAKWNEYEEQLAKCLAWLDEMEPKITSFNEFQEDFLSKRKKLEEFQSDQLQSVFENQSEFNRLNLKAQLLLETYHNSSISDSVSDLTGRYNLLVVLAKDILHSLEQRYQEHQQHHFLISESSEFIESCKERLESIRRTIHSKNYDELNSKMMSLKQLLNNVESAAEHKVSYVFELSEKVLQHTSPEGQPKVRDETENLRAEYASIISAISETHLILEEQISAVQEFEKVWKEFTGWLNGLKEQYNDALELDPADALDKLESINEDIQSKGNLITRFREYEDDEEKVKQFIEDQMQPFMCKLTSGIAKLDAEIKSAESYKQAIEDLESFLKEKRDEIDTMNDEISDFDDAKLKMDQLKQLSAINWDDTLSLIARLSKELGKPSDDLDRINTELEQLKNLINDKISYLQALVDKWNSFEKLHTELKEYLDSFEATLGSPDEDKHLLVEDGNSVKPQFEQLKSLGAELIQSAKLDVIKENLDEINDRYESLMKRATEAALKQDEISALVSDFKAKLSSFSIWIKDFSDKCSISCPSLYQELTALQDVQIAECPRGQQLFATLMESSDNLISVTNDEPEAEALVTEVSEDLEEE
ncbi:Nesprin-1 [Halotydeus destructor]|nr:Nesprin-1 [Halotydeus destructor]